MNDPRMHPVPGAEVEVLGKNKSSRRRVLRVFGDNVEYQPLSSRNIMKANTSTLAAWRKWAFNGHVVSRGKE